MSELIDDVTVFHNETTPDRSVNVRCSVKLFCRNCYIADTTPVEFQVFPPSAGFEGFAKFMRVNVKEEKGQALSGPGPSWILQLKC